MGTNDDSWKFRKMKAGVSPTDYRESLSREGLLEYLKEREANFDEIYHGEYEKREVLISDIVALRAELAALRSELAAAQAAAGKLKAALEQIVAKSDAERPEKLDGEDLFSFGITRGLWRMGVIAREALAAALAKGE